MNCLSCDHSRALHSGCEGHVSCCTVAGCDCHDFIEVGIARARTGTRYAFIAPTERPDPPIDVDARMDVRREGDHVLIEVIGEFGMPTFAFRLTPSAARRGAAAILVAAGTDGR